MQAFPQEWNVEVERRSDSPSGARPGGRLTYAVNALARVAKLVRRAALKRPWPSGHVGSNPTPGTRHAPYP